MRTEKKIRYFVTEFLFQFEMNAEMEISKNQWRSTGGKAAWVTEIQSRGLNNEK